MNNEVTLDISALRNRAAELGLKRDWLARRVGVAPKTVQRWLQGRVRMCKRENAQALATVLKKRVADITLTRAEDQLATPADQKAAAKALVASRVMDKLGALGEWGMLESLLKASLVADLPLCVLGDLYDKLSIACWRQDKFGLSERYARKAGEIARRCGDKALLAASMHNQANLAWWRGEIKDALTMYRKCLRMKAYLPPRMVCAVQSNLGSVLCELGEIAESLELLHAALRGFARHGTPMNRSISHCQLAMLHLEEGDLGMARKHNTLARREGAREEYNRAEPLGALLAAEIYIRGGGDANGALAQAHRALEAFAHLKIEEGLNYRLASRVARYGRNFKQAQAWLRHSLKLSEKFPVEHALGLAEAGQLECALGGSMRSVEALRRKAIVALRAVGAKRRVKQLQQAKRGKAMSPDVSFHGRGKLVKKAASGRKLAGGIIR